MCWCYGGAERTNRRIANSLDGVDATCRASWNFPGTIEFDVRHQVIWEVDWSTIGKVMFQSKLLSSSINLTKVVGASVGSTGGASQDEGWAPNYDDVYNDAKNQKATGQDTNKTS